MTVEFSPLSIGPTTSIATRRFAQSLDGWGGGVGTLEAIARGTLLVEVTAETVTALASCDRQKAVLVDIPHLHEFRGPIFYRALDDAYRIDP